MKAETDLYCPGCWDKIYGKGEELMSLFFPRAEERCSQCSTMLTRRAGGGVRSPWKFLTSRSECLKRAMNELKADVAEIDRMCREYPETSIDLGELGDKLDELIQSLESTARNKE